MTGLTTEERKNLRLALHDLGFIRTPPLVYSEEKHLDRGDGAYTEEWSGPGGTHLSLDWAPKLVEPVIPTVNQPRFPIPKHMKYGPTFLGYAGERGQYDLWVGMDDEHEDVIAVVWGEGSFIITKDEFTGQGVVLASADPLIVERLSAARQGAVRVCWIEGKV